MISLVLVLRNLIEKRSSLYSLDEEISRNLVLTKANFSSISPSSERLEELCVVCGFVCRKWGYVIGGSMMMRKQE